MAKKKLVAYSDRVATKREVPSPFSDGWYSPLYIKGKTTYKPKIPKSSKSKNIYDGIFIRKLGNSNYLYDYTTSVYVVALLKEIDHIAWIDRNRELVQEKIDKVMVQSDMFEKDTNGLK